MKPSIVFFGNERLATGLPPIKPRTLLALIETGYPIAAVVASQSQSNTKRELEVDKLATAHNIPVLTPERPEQIIQQLKEYAPSIGILVAYGQIVPQSVIDVFPYGIINLHPSLLPSYRGSTPIEQAILDGVTTTGVSIMGLTAKMDAGPIFSQTLVKLDGNEQKYELAEQLLQVGSAMIIALLEGLFNGPNKLSVQDDTQATYTKRINKSDGIINWNKPAQQIVQEIRAYLGWPGSRTTLAGRDIIITQAHLLAKSHLVQGPTLQPGRAFKTEDGELAVACNEGVLIIDYLKPAGKGEMIASAFLAGNRSL